MSDYTLAQQRWQTPDPTFSPAPIWWWSGDRLEPARLRWQLERFAEGGVYNLVILNLAPTGPLHGSRADDPAFLTREWWAIFRGVCHDALELGIKLWFYDQIGFSGANLQGQLVRAEPSFVGQQIQSRVQECDGPARCLFPDGALPLGAWQIDDAGHTTALVVQDGVVHSTATTPHRVRLVYAVTKGFDYMSVAACAALRATVHEAFEREVGDYFGSVIVGSFQDELPSMPTWSADFADSFVAQYGYDLRDYLLALFEGDDAQSQQVRIDYQCWRAKRSEESFFKPFYAWHEQHGLICGFDQQSPARMALPIGAVDEYADYMQTHRWYGAPGSDHHGNGKIHSSMAHLYQRPRSWIEAFHSSGWGGTLEETFDWLVPWLRAGLTLYDPHAVYYSTRGGWWEWAPPSTCWRQPYWRHYRHFAEAVMRLTGVMALGRHQCDIAVMFPTTTVQAHLTMHGAYAIATRAEQVFVEITGSMFWNNPQPGLLERARRDFDMLDDDSLERAQVAGGVLAIADERYRCLILPALTHLTPKGVAQVNAFVQAGGLVLVVGSLPSGIQLHHQVIVVDTVDELAPYLDQLPRRVDGDVHVLERVVDQTPLWLVTPTVSGSQFAWNGHWNSTPYDFDADRLPRHVDIKINVPGLPRQWRITDGTMVTIPQNPDGTWRVDLADAPIAVVVLDGAEVTVVSHPTSLRERVDLAGEWQVVVVPTLDNRWGDMNLPASNELLMPHTMRFKTPEGTPYVQGFETYGWYMGPCAVSELPPPLPSLTEHGLDVANWSPLVYSLTRGMYKDTLHWGMLGPKGYVPEEFMHFGTVARGDAVRVRTTVVLADAFVGAFVLAAAAAKRVWLDGVRYDHAPLGYQWFIDVQLAAGRHVIEFELAPEQTLNLRGYWALVAQPERFARPNWIMQADAPQSATYVSFAHTFVLAEPSSHADVMVVADVPIRVVLDGAEIGRQGGFDPYGSTVRVQPYHVKGVAAGTHQLIIEALDAGRGVSIMVDGVWYDGNQVVGTVMTGQGWQVTRQGDVTVDAIVRRRQWVDLTFDTDHALYVDMDPGWPLMWRRQHPLPGAHWLEDVPADGSVLRIVPDAYPNASRNLDVRWRIPATATRMYLPGHDAGEITIDGMPCRVDDGVVLLPARSVIAQWQVAVPSGQVGMNVPVRYAHGVGTTMLPADASDIGYADFSGALRFRKTVTIADKQGRWILDLGRVRGTVAVFVNGIQAGVRIWAPFVVDVSSFLQIGVNQIEIELTNTMASYLAAHSPSHYTPAYQQVSGVYGPIVLSRYLIE